MKKRLSILDNLEIARPCNASWDEMNGSEKERFCQSCQMSVFNISDMTRIEAEKFLSERRPSARVCTKFYRRADGTILTDNCPKSLRKARDLALALKKKLVATASLFLASFALSDSSSFAQTKTERIHTIGQPIDSLPIVPDVRGSKQFKTSPVTLETYRQQVQYQLQSVASALTGENANLVVTISGDGKIGDLRLLKSTGSTKKDEKLLQNLRQSLIFAPTPGKQIVTVTSN